MNFLSLTHNRLLILLIIGLSVLVACTQSQTGVRDLGGVASDFFRDRLADGSLGPEMVWIPAGSFRMWDIHYLYLSGGDDYEKPVHRVSVGKFAMGRYEVTVGEFRQFVNATGYNKTEAEKGEGCWTYDKDGWKYKKDANWRNPKFSQSDNHPVVCVSWNDAVAYVEWLSEQTGHKYRLPTEAEWEYAARAGTETARDWGNDPNKACSYANVHDNTSKAENGFSWKHHECTDGYAKTAPVGSFKPNTFELFDVLGNVWEWTCSEYESKYGGKELRCTKNINKNNRLSFRGGSWYYGVASWMRSANRFDGSASLRGIHVGFRVARF